jgi:hypothetical protein
MYRFLTPRRAAFIILGATIALATGCNVVSEQASATAPFVPTATLLNGGSVVAVAEQVIPAALPGFNSHIGHIQGVEEFALVGDFTEGGELVPSPTGVDLQAYFSTDASVDSAFAGQHRVALWGPLHLAQGETRHVAWDESAKLTGPGKLDLQRALISGTPFTIAIVRTSATGSISIPQLKVAIAAVLDIGE